MECVQISLRTIGNCCSGIRKDAEIVLDRVLLFQPIGMLTHSATRFTNANWGWSSIT